LLTALVCFAAHPLMAQTEPSVSQKWLEKLPAVPEFKAPASTKAWEEQRAEIRKQLSDLLGKLPPRPKTPDVKTFSREDRGDYLVEKFQFDNGAGAVVPGYLLLPKKPGPGGKSPAILYCHQHGGQYGKGGKEELFIAGVPAPVAPGPELARHGYVVIAIDAYCFGERDGQGPGGEKEKGAACQLSSSKFNLWVGRTLWGMIVRDDLMALDYLLSRPEVDKGRVGVTGFSMGATRSWWVMALDDRLKAGVPVSCLTRYQNLIAHESLSAHGIYYFVPGMLNHFDTEAAIALLAPRPVLFMTGDADGGSPADGIRIIEAKVRPVYELYRRGEDYQSELYPGLGHKYLPEMWQKTLTWMDKSLKQ